MDKFFKSPKFYLSVGQFFGVSAIISLIFFQLAEQKMSRLEHQINLSRQLLDAVSSYTQSLSDDQLQRIGIFSQELVLGTLLGGQFENRLEIEAIPDQTRDLDYRIRYSNQVTALEAEAEKSLLSNMTIRLAIQELKVRLAAIGKDDFEVKLGSLEEINEDLIDRVEDLYFDEKVEKRSGDLEIQMELTERFKNLNREISANNRVAHSLFKEIENSIEIIIEGYKKELTNIVSSVSALIFGAFALQIFVFLILQSFEYREGRIFYD